MSDVPDLCPQPQRIKVDAEQVRRLVGGQFPQWAGLPVRPVANGGWDNRTFHLGTGMSVRLPSAAEYALAVDKEGHLTRVFSVLGVSDRTSAALWAQRHGLQL